MCHDYDHSGFNNDFLIKSKNPLAILYNDASPNENHHVAGAYSLMLSDSNYHFSKDMAPEDRNILRAAIIELVLATDMKKHFGLLSQFQVGEAGTTAAQTANLAQDISLLIDTEYLAVGTLCISSCRWGPRPPQACK